MKEENYTEINCQTDSSLSKSDKNLKKIYSSKPNHTHINTKKQTIISQ